MAGGVGVSLLHDYSGADLWEDRETPADREPMCVGCGHWAPTFGDYCSGCAEED